MNVSIQIFSYIGIAEKGLSTNYIFSSINTLKNLNHQDALDYLKDQSIPYYNLEKLGDSEKIPSEYENIPEQESNIKVGKYNIYYLHNNLLIRYPTEIQFVDPFRNRVSYPIIMMLILVAVIVYFIVKDKDKSLALVVDSDYKKVVDIINSEQRDIDNINKEELISEEFNNIADHILNYKKKISEQYDLEKRLKKEKLEEFAYMAHDIKTPLTIIKGYLELIAASPSNEMTIKRKENAEIQFDRILKYIDEMLIMLKLEVLDEENFECINCKKLTEYLEMEITYFLESTHRTVQVNIKYDNMEDYYIVINYTYLERAVLNLLKNAIENTKNDDEIDIEIKITEDNYLIEVRDSGNGFPEHLLLNIQNSSNKIKTGGFGLRFAKRVVEINHGRFEIENSSGAIARIVLPLK